jgi:cytidylate kinase
MSKAITIDGPAAAGKTTTAKFLAKSLNDFLYVDTGAFYRTAAIALKRKGINIKDAVPAKELAIYDILGDTRINAEAYQNEQNMYLNGNLILDHLLRTEEISQLSSAASALPGVRDYVNDAIRAYAAANNVIMEGRDTGTVILPDANIKFYLTANLNVRSERRLKDLQRKNVQTDIGTVYADMKLRDERDMNRDVAPLQVAKSGIYIDNSEIAEHASNRLILGIVDHLL